MMAQSEHIGTREYLQRDFRSDFVASMTVTTVAIPQSLAYAIVAGVPPIYGLYTTIMGTLLGSLLRSCPFVQTGVSNASAMVVASTMSTAAVAPFIETYGPLDILLLLTFMSGMIQVAFGLLRMSGVVRYISNSVVLGLTTGAGVLIAGNQVWTLLGFDDAERQEAMRIFVVGVFRFLWLAGQRLMAGEIPLAPSLLGLSAILLLFLGARLAPRFPMPLASIIFAALIVYVFELDGHGVQIVRDLGAIGRNINPIHIPPSITDLDYHVWTSLMGGAMAMAILSLVEGVSVAKAMATQSDQKVDFTREFIGQGLVNMLGPFFRCFLSSGSFIRSAIVYEAGARTRMANFYSGLWILLTVIVFAPFANWIPIPALSGLLVFMAMRIIYSDNLTLVWKSGAMSRIVFLITFSAVLLIGMKYAIFVGVFASIFFLLRATGEPGIKRIVLHPNGDVEEMPAGAGATATPVALIDLSGAFYFAAVQDLDMKIRHAIPPETRVLILRLRDMRLLGSTGLGMLKKFCRSLRAKHITVILSGVDGELEDLMRRSGFAREIGEQNIFYADAFVFRSLQLAFARARAIVENQASRAARRAPGATEGQHGLAATGGGAPGGAPTSTAVTAETLMRHDMLRFGIRHSLREAVWLLHEGRRRKGVLFRLFLQGEDATLAGSVDAALILRQFLRVSGTAARSEGGDDLYRIRKGWSLIQQRRLQEIADRRPPGAPTHASLEEIAKTMLESDYATLPVLRDRRIIGQIYLRDVIEALDKQKTHKDAS